MGQAARLRVIRGGLEPRVAFETAPDVGAPPIELRFADIGRRRRPAVLFALVLSAILHGTLIAWGLMMNLSDGEALAEGGSEELLVIEGVSVILLDGVESAASDGADALPVAEAVTAVSTAATVPEPEALATVDLEAPSVRDDSLSPVAAAAAQAMAIEPEWRTVADDARVVAEVDATVASLTGDAAVVSTADATHVEADRPTNASTVQDRPVGAMEDVPVRAVEPDIGAAATPVVASVAPTDALADSEVGPAAEIAGADATAAVADTVARAQLSDDVAVPRSGGTAPPPVVEATANIADDWQVATAEIVPEPVQPPMPRLRPDVPIPAAKAPSPVPPKPAAKPPVQPKKAAPAAVQSTGSVAEKAASGPQKGTAGAGGKSSDERGAAALSDYKSKLAARLRRFRSYPAAARAQQLTGTATVSFTVASSGAVTSASLAKGSGHAILDQAALEMVRRASPFPPIPQSAGVSTLTVSVPVRFDAR